MVKRINWNNKKLQQKHIDMVIEEIERGIDRGDRVIIFPESIFPLFLNQSESLMTLLEALSNEITIIAGGLYIDGDNNPKNTTYIFKDGTFQIASKAVLVPFGEYNPLPSWLGDIINRVFFDGAPDYVSSLKVTDYTIDGVKYRNAICYEGTSEKLYRDNPKNMILISNNGWSFHLLNRLCRKLYFNTTVRGMGHLYTTLSICPPHILYVMERYLTSLPPNLNSFRHTHTSFRHYRRQA